MAIDDALPLFLENGGDNYNAVEFRRLFRHLLGTGRQDGVLSHTDLLVSEKSTTPDMSVDVALGAVAIEGTEVAIHQGAYYVYSDATVNLAISASDPTDPRIDLIAAQVRDTEYSGADDDARLVVLEGTAASTPSEPTVPDNTVVLARVDVAAAAASITDADITDRRTLVDTTTVPRGQVGSPASKTTDQTLTDAAGVTDITGVSKAVTGVSNRRLKITATVFGFSPAVAGQQFAELRIRDGSNNTLKRQIHTLGATSQDFGGGTIVVWDEPASSSITYKLSVDVNATMDLLAGATHPCQIVVEDVGAVPIT